jgi:aldehyde dehydrogenase (NAD+)
MKSILNACQINATNPGACVNNTWITHRPPTTPITSYNPSTNTPIASVIPHTDQDYEAAIHAAYATFLEWRLVPAPKRGEIIRDIGQRLREQKSALGSLVSLETGKTKQEGDGEVQEMIDMADFAVGQSRMLYGKTMHSERPMHRMYEQWHPLGIVGVISAFNFPVAVWAWNAFIAAICGNTVIWRPSSKTPLCAIAIQHLCNQVMQAHQMGGVFSLLISDNTEQANTFVNDTRLPLISFTGSSTVGKRVNENVSKRLGRCLLECSGNNAMIIDQSANIPLAVSAVVFGAIGTSGQRCTTTRRLFIHESRFTTVVNALKTAFDHLRIGDPLDPNTDMGPLINQDAVDQYHAAIKKATELGAEILWGGQALQGPGFFVTPCLIKANNDWPIVQAETFAPILYVMPFKTIEDAIALQNDVCQGLSSALFTENLKNAELFLSQRGSDCGIANVNIGTSGAEIGGAFGGEKDTGGGREAGSDAWKAYMRRQTNTINWGNTLPLAQGIENTFTTP